MRRPIKVRWFSPQWNEYRMKSYLNKKRAIELGQTLYANGAYEVKVWDNDSLDNSFLYRSKE